MNYKPLNMKVHAASEESLRFRLDEDNQRQKEIAKYCKENIRNSKIILSKTYGEAKTVGEGIND